MKTVSELGALIKKKYPGDYDHLDDAEVGRRIKRKYPDSYTEFSEQALELRTPPLFDQAAQLQKYYNPSRGRWTARWQAAKSAQRGLLQLQLNAEQTQVLQMAAEHERAVIQGQIDQLTFEQFIARHEVVLLELHNTAFLNQAAVEQGYTVDNWQAVQMGREHNDEEIRKARELSDIHIEEVRETEAIKLQREISESSLRIREHKEKSETELNNEIRLMEQQVRFAIIADYLTDNQKVSLIQELLDDLYIQIEKIESSEFLPTTKQRMIEDRESSIERFRKQKDETANRLLLPNHR